MLGNNSDDVSLWWVPLTYTHMPQPDFVNTRPSHWLKAEQSIEINTEADAHNWMVFNIQRTGQYKSIVLHYIYDIKRDFSC